MFIGRAVLAERQQRLRELQPREAEFGFLIDDAAHQFEIARPFALAVQLHGVRIAFGVVGAQPQPRPRFARALRQRDPSAPRG